MLKDIDALVDLPLVIFSLTFSCAGAVGYVSGHAVS